MAKDTIIRIGLYSVKDNEVYDEQTFDMEVDNVKEVIFMSKKIFREEYDIQPKTIHLEHRDRFGKQVLSSFRVPFLATDEKTGKRHRAEAWVTWRTKRLTETLY